MMVDQSSLSAAFWCFGVSMYVDALNCVLNSHSETVTPIEAVTGRAPDIGVRFKFPFGTKAVVARVGKKDHTFQTKNEYATVLGAADDSGQVPVFIPGKGKVSYNRVNITPVLVQEKVLSADQIEQLQPTTKVVDNKSFDEAVEFKSPMPIGGESELPFVQCPLTVNSSNVCGYDSSADDMSASEGEKSDSEAVISVVVL